MTIIFDMSSGDIESDTSQECSIERRRACPDNQLELQLAVHESVTTETRAHAEPAHLAGELLKKL